MRRKRKGGRAPSVVEYTSSANDDGNDQLCIYAECTWSGERVGPIWGHTEKSMRRALATLTTQCDCPARFHSAHFFEGHQILPVSHVSS